MASLTSCFGNNGENYDDSDPDVLSIAIVTDSAEEDTLNAFINGYKKIPGNEDKKIKVVKMQGGYAEYINKAFLKNGPANIIQVYDYNCEYYTNADLDGRGTSLLKPISSFMKRDGINENDFYESVIEMSKSKIGSDDMYWVPRDYNKVVCAYNTKIFELAGVEVPSGNWTWSQFVSTCEQLLAAKSQIRQYSGSTSFYPVDINRDFYAVYYPLLQSYGVDLLDKTNKTCFGGAGMDKAKLAWGKVLNMMDEGLAASTGDDKDPFTNKQAAMKFITRPKLPKYVKSLGKDVIDFVSLPTYDDSDATKSYIGMGCTGYGITTSCPDSKMELAWDFLKYIISEDGQNAFSEAGSGIPCLKKLAEDENAAFKKYLVTDNYHPHHEVFTDYSDRDLPMNFMNGVEMNKQYNILEYIKNNTLKNFANKKGDARNAYYATYKAGLEEVWRSNA